MATDTLHTNSSAWPQVGNPPPNAMSPTDPNPEWEMVADETTANTDGNGSGSGDCKPTADNNNSNNNTTSTNNTEHVVILPADIGSSIQSNKSKIKGRPRSATIGGQASYSSSTSTPTNNNMSTTPNFHRSSSTNPATPGDTSVNSDLSSRTKRRVFRRCVSTPDLLMSDKDHEVIVEDESDDDDDDNSNSTSSVVGESFEVVSDNDDEEEEEEGENETSSDHIDVSGDDTDEPLFMIDDEDTDIHRCDDEESATLVSTPSMDTSTAWTMASAVPSTATAATSTGSMWGMKKSPSFAEMLAKNIDSSDSNNNNDNNAGASGSVGWGSDKTKTEAMLRDSHRRHHLRVKTKPKFIVTEEVVGAKTMKHAHSTGDLSQMLVGAEQERARMFGQGRKRMTKKQFSDIMEEDEEGDFVIGRGSGGGGGGGGGGNP
mmetsp:Transcript_1783/g.2476  ORF Transcript_1783/g.2476 Transcript_1783/m.2476 type:complete len:431 (+) Transcript_1783:221-1513(+)